MEDIRVPATKKKSAVTKVTALFLFTLALTLFLTLFNKRFFLSGSRNIGTSVYCESEDSFSLRSNLFFFIVIFLLTFNSIISYNFIVNKMPNHKYHDEK
jgi:hypothetical protein